MLRPRLAAAAHAADRCAGFPELTWHASWCRTMRWVVKPASAKGWPLVVAKRPADSLPPIRFAVYKWDLIAHLLAGAGRDRTSANEGLQTWICGHSVAWRARVTLPEVSLQWQVAGECAAECAECAAGLSRRWVVDAGSQVTTFGRHLAWRAK